MRELQRTLPHEDVLLLVDPAYAPYARRPPRVVVDRLRRLGAELTGAGAKAVVLASQTATLDAAGSSLGLRVPVVGLEPALRRAVGRPATGGVALVAGAGCLRAPPLLAELRRAGGRRRVTADLWPDLADLVEAGPPGAAPLGRLVEERVAALLEGGTGVVALGCVHAAAVALAVVAAAGGRLEVVDPVVLTVARLHGLLRRHDLPARRRRAGWCRLISSRPTAAAAWPRPAGGGRRSPQGPTLASDPLAD